MRTATYVIAAAGVASAAAEGSKKLKWTKEELEESTLAFVRENEERVKYVRNKNLRKLKSSRSNTRQRKLGGKGGKGGKNSDGWSWSGSGSGSGSGWSRSGKGGKSGGDGLDGGHQEEAFYILPTSCPGKCISSDVDEEYAFKDVLETCKHDESQKWNVLSDGSYVMVESYDHPHWCISVNYQDGDKDKMFEDTCMGEYYLALKECGSYGTQWYFTGGQLISSMCWAGGLSSYMAVYLDDDKQCEDNLSVYGKSPNDAVMRADTFMFVSHLPESPIEVDVDYT